MEIKKTWNKGTSWFHKFRSENDSWLLALYLLFILVSYPVMYSSSAPNVHDVGSSLLLKHSFFVLLSFITVFIFNVTPLKLSIYTGGWFAYIVGTILAMYVAFLGGDINGAKRWIIVGGVSIQPSEIIKFSIIIIGAIIFSAKEANFYNSLPIRATQSLWRKIKEINPLTISFKSKNGKANILSRLIKKLPKDSPFEYHKVWSYLILVGVSTLVIILHNLSMGLIFFIITMSMIFLMSKARYFFYRLFFYAFFLIGLGFAFLKFGSFETMRSMQQSVGGRWVSWKGRISPASIYNISPEEFEAMSEQEKEDLEFSDADKNRQPRRAKMAIVKGIRSGFQGPSSSRARYDLPEASSDFVFAFIIEEYGYIGLFLIPIIYLLLFFRIAAVGKQSNNKMHRGILFGIGVLFLTQMILNMFVAVGLMPVTGQTLPMISTGGSSFLIYSACFGLVLAISKHNKHQQILRKKMMRETIGDF